MDNLREKLINDDFYKAGIAMCEPSERARIEAYVLQFMGMFESFREDLAASAANSVVINQISGSIG